MAKEKLGSNATFTGGNKGLSILDEYAYAYSGIVSVNNSETTLLEFTTPNQVIKGYFQNGMPIDQSDNMLHKLYLNGVLVFGYTSPSASETSTPWGMYQALIPPNTLVKLTATNTGSSSGRDITADFVGRVYG